jgi:hypothetical protein
LWKFIAVNGIFGFCALRGWGFIYRLLVILGLGEEWGFYLYFGKVDEKLRILDLK